MALDDRVKTRLIFLGFFIILIGLSILMIGAGEGEWNDPECEGSWDLFNLSDCEYEQTPTEKSLEDIGSLLAGVGLCGFFITILMLFWATFWSIFTWRNFIYGNDNDMPFGYFCRLMVPFAF